MTTDSDSNGRENQPRRAGRPSKLTPKLKEEILTAIGKGGCTYADACLKAGISTSTFQLWKQKGQEQARGQYSDFSDELKRAEADFRAHHLKKNRCGLLTRQPATDRSPKSLFMLAPPHRRSTGRLHRRPTSTVSCSPSLLRSHRNSS